MRIPGPAGLPTSTLIELNHTKAGLITALAIVAATAPALAGFSSASHRWWRVACRQPIASDSRHHISGLVPCIGRRRIRSSHTSGRVTVGGEAVAEGCRRSLISRLLNEEGKGTERERPWRALRAAAAGSGSGGRQACRAVVRKAAGTEGCG